MSITLIIENPSEDKEVLELTFDKPFISIGSLGTDDVKLYGSSTVLPNHASIHFDKDKYRLLNNCYSTILVNGDKISEVELNHNDLIQFGDSGPRLKVKLLSPEQNLEVLPEETLENNSTVIDIMDETSQAVSQEEDTHKKEINSVEDQIIPLDTKEQVIPQETISQTEEIIDKKTLEPFDKSLETITDNDNIKTRENKIIKEDKEFEIIEKEEIIIVENTESSITYKEQDYEKVSYDYLYTQEKDDIEISTPQIDNKKKEKSDSYRGHYKEYGSKITDDSSKQLKKEDKKYKKTEKPKTTEKISRVDTNYSKFLVKNKYDKHLRSWLARSLIIGGIVALIPCIGYLLNTFLPVIFALAAVKNFNLENIPEKRGYYSVLLSGTLVTIYAVVIGIITIIVNVFLAGVFKDTSSGLTSSASLTVVLVLSMGFFIWIIQVILAIIFAGIQAKKSQ